MLRKSVNVNFFKVWSPEMAYVLGFFAADGNMIIGKRGNCYIEFDSCDKESIVKIKKLLESKHKIAERNRGPKCKTAYRIQIGSRNIYTSLLNLGMLPAKSKIMEFPDIPVDYLPSFVRGYFDGDGHVYFGKQWRKDRERWQWVLSVGFTSGNKVFLKRLWKSLKKHISGGCLYEKNRGYGLSFSRHDSLALFKFMYHNVTSKIYLDRKYNTFLKAFNILNLRA